MNAVEVEILHTEVFEKNLEAYESKQYRVIGNQGSTRSTKTYSLCQLLSTYIPFNETKSISIVSPSLPHLKRGARRDFLEILENANLYKDDNFNKTDQIYHYPETDSYVEFFGAEDAGKVRGPGRDILYVNEANLIPFPVYKQLALRTRDMIFLDFNPADEQSWVYDVVDATGNLLIHSTYKDNPFLSDSQIQEIESLKDADENLWKVFGLGLRGTSSESIYTHWKYCDEMPGRGEVIYGQDYGFNNPSALVQVEIYEGAIYVDEIIYQSKLTTNDLVQLYTTLGLKRTLIYSDSAEPKTIEEINRAGFKAVPSDKDVTEGIRKVKSMPLYITKRSANILKEIKSYKWKKDKNERVLDEPVKLNDHSMDAIRYAVFTHLAKPKKELTFIDPVTGQLIKV